VKAIERIEEIKKRRQDKFILNRLQVSTDNCAGCSNSSMVNHSINVGSFQNMPALNNPISENECEEPPNNQKAFKMSDITNVVRGLSTLQTRNIQQKTHK
jgi:hypothetical protein